MDHEQRHCVIQQHRANFAYIKLDTYLCIYCHDTQPRTTTPTHDKMKGKIGILTKAAKAGVVLLQPLHGVRSWRKTWSSKRRNAQAVEADVPSIEIAALAEPHGVAYQNVDHEHPQDSANENPTDDEPESQDVDASCRPGSTDALLIDEPHFDAPPTSGPVRQPKVQQTVGAWLAACPDPELAASFHAAVVSHRQIKGVEEEVKTQLEELIPSCQEFRAETQKLMGRIADAEAEDSDPESDNPRVEAMYERLEEVQQAHGSALAKQNEIRDHLREVYEGMRGEQFDLFDILEEALEVGKPVSAGVESDELEYDNGPVTDDPMQEVSDDHQKDLLYTFDLWHRELDDANYQLNNRHEAFNRQLEFERDQPHEVRLAKSEIDARHFHETQRMTRRFIEVEAAYDKAKAALIAAGMQPPGSDIESGFVDDVDDGYRTSFQQDEIDSVDPECVLRWLGGIPNCSPGDNLGVQVPKVDDWDSTEVEMWESRSMLAEGSNRRRIEKWRGVMGSVEV